MKTTGSRAEVWHETAFKTTGGLKKKDLVKNKHGYIVSKKKSNLLKKINKNPLKSYLQSKGSQTFGPKKNKKTKKQKKNGLTSFINLFI